jgi:uncharacterized protein (DUF169 family)
MMKGACVAETPVPTEMVAVDRDLAILKKLGLQKQPVGVKFLCGRPDGIPRLEKKIALCEMVHEAQAGKPFYADLENHECAGPIALGMVDIDPFFSSGQVGVLLEGFDEARACRRIYEDLPTLKKGTCNYTVFAALDDLSFNPDILMFEGSVRQMEIVLRSMSYSTGWKYESKITPVLGCAWTMIYPYISGRVNYYVTGLIGGQIAHGVGTEGNVVVSVPWDCLPTMLENLSKMKWVPASYAESREKNIERFEQIATGSHG